jgi:uncharacterized membrane protein YccC
VIKFRILDTLVGAALAAAGNFFFWPKWEKQELPSNIEASLQANLDYFQEIRNFYQEKGKLPTSYKLARKQAFLKIGDLNGAFQRMAQEPKSQKQQLRLFYEIVSLNHTFLSALASLGTYIRTHTTTEASPDFKDYTQRIVSNLEVALNYLN